MVLASTFTILLASDMPLLADRGNSFVVIGLVAALVFAFARGKEPQSRCQNCRELNRRGAVYCAQCGTRLPGR